MTMKQPKKRNFEGDDAGQGAAEPRRVSKARRAQIESAIRAGKVQLRLWSDGEDRIYRVQLISSTGDAALDAAIRNDVLQSLMIRECETAAILVAKGFAACGGEDVTGRSTQQVARRVKYWGTNV